MAKTTTLNVKIKGADMGTFTLMDDMAEWDGGDSPVPSEVIEHARKFTSDDATRVFVTVVKCGTRWATRIIIRPSVNEGITWDSGTHSGTRGVAALKALTAMRDAIESESFHIDIPAAPSAADKRREREAAIIRERARLAEQRAKRNAATPAADSPAPAVRESVADGRARAVREFYAAGNPVPAEVKSLPDPKVSGSAWSGGDSGTGAEVVPCDYVGAPVDGTDLDGMEGQCVECRATVKLGDSGDIQRHNLYGQATPAAKGLKSRSMDTVDHGSVPGSPADANKRRVMEVLCKGSAKVIKDSEGGPEECPTCARTITTQKAVRKGKAVWIFSDHERPGDSFQRSGKGERKVTPNGSGADAGKGARDFGSVDGSAMTGRSLDPVQPTRGMLAAAGTWSLPAMVPARIDDKVAGTYCPVCKDTVDRAHKGRNRAWRRRHSVLMRRHHEAREAAKAKAKARKVATGEEMPSAERRKLRKAASIGSTAAGTQAASGLVIHAECIPVKKSGSKAKAKKSVTVAE